MAAIAHRRVVRLREPRGPALEDPLVLEMLVALHDPLRPALDQLPPGDERETLPQPSLLPGETSGKLGGG